MALDETGRLLDNRTHSERLNAAGLAVFNVFDKAAKGMPESPEPAKAYIGKI